MPFSGFSTKRWWNKHKEDSSLSIFEVLLGFFCLSILVEISQMKAKRKMRSEKIYCRFPFLTSFFSCSGFALSFASRMKIRINLKIN